MVSFGPTLRGVHSPSEKMHIPAVERFWNQLTLILRKWPISKNNRFGCITLGTCEGTQIQNYTCRQHVPNYFNIKPIFMYFRHLFLTGTVAACIFSNTKAYAAQENADSISPASGSANIELKQDSASNDTFKKLTENDYRRAAKELGVEIAAIKAVVQIEAGLKLQGFHAPRVPLINFDLTMFTKAAIRRGTKLNKFKKTLR